VPAHQPNARPRDWLDRVHLARLRYFFAIDRHGNLAMTRQTDQSMTLIVKRCANAAGLDWRSYAGHSLRAGLASHPGSSCRVATLAAPDDRCNRSGSRWAIARRAARTVARGVRPRAGAQLSQRPGVRYAGARLRSQDDA